MCQYLIDHLNSNISLKKTLKLNPALQFGIFAKAHQCSLNHDLASLTLVNVLNQSRFPSLDPFGRGSLNIRIPRTIVD